LSVGRDPIAGAIWATVEHGVPHSIKHALVNRTFRINTKNSCNSAHLIIV
jgi:hypothetical protein